MNSQVELRLNSKNIGPKIEVVCLGEALIDFLPAHAGQTLQEAGLLKRVAGGSTANVAVGLARLGRQAAFLGKLGDDPFGHFLRDTLLANKVDVSRLLLSNQANTGLTFAWTDPVAHHEARYLFYRAAAADRKLEAGEIDQNWLGRAKILQFGSLMLSVEPARTALYTALACARAQGLLTCYDVNMRLPAWPDHASARADMLSLLDSCDIIKLNRYELAFLTGEQKLEKGVARLWQPPCRLLIVTLDREGCYYLSNQAEGFAPGFAVKVVDTVGAGDGFMAALLAQLLNLGDTIFTDKTTLAQVCRYANAAGAITTMRAGAIPALPTRRQIERFLKVMN